MVLYDVYCYACFSISGAAILISVFFFFFFFPPSLTSMPPDCHWVKGFSRSIPPESCPAFLQVDGFPCRLRRKLQWKMWINFLTNLPASPSPLLRACNFLTRCLCGKSVNYFVIRFSNSVKWQTVLKIMSSTGCELTSSGQNACSCHLTQGHAITLCNTEGK